MRRTFGAVGGAEIRALDGVTAAIDPGRAVALTGPSGSGKSTLLHVLAGIEALDGGRVLVGDVEVSALARKALVAYRRTVGLVFQRFHLLPALDVLDNVLAPKLAGRPTAADRAVARELLERVGLADRERDLPARMSGGQQQRVAIARALINEPRVLFADEPTGSLDSANGERVLDLLLQLRDERGLTLVIATHDPAVADRCDERVRLVDGRVEAD